MRAVVPLGLLLLTVVAPGISTALPTGCVGGDTLSTPETDVLLVIHRTCVGTQSPPTMDAASDGTCSSTAYRRAGWHNASWYNNIKIWTVGAGVDANGALAAFRAAARTWDDVTSRQVFGSMGLYVNTPGTRNGVHEIAWSVIDASTIAVTYTWIDTRDQHVLETDAVYNAALRWTLTGAAGRYDVQNVATHEFGHALGLDHVATTSANACLTMYPTGASGETLKRSLGAGDWNGMRAIYGP